MNPSDSRFATAFATLVLAWAVTLAALSLGGAPASGSAPGDAAPVATAAMR